MALRLLRSYASSDESDDDRGAPLAFRKPEAPVAVPAERSAEGAPPSDDSGDMSEMVRRNNFINANLHGPENKIEPGGPVFVGELALGDPSRRRVIKIEDSDDDDDDDEDDSDSDDDDDDEEEDPADGDSVSYTNSECDWENLTDSENDCSGVTSAAKSFDKGARPFLKVKGELGLEDLPPIEDLKISVDNEECEQIGTIHNIVDKLVIVRSLPNKPSLDLETVLFLDNGAKVLGQIFDVFGQVTEPFYSVRFNSTNHIKENNIASGMSVYYAPKTNHTNFIVLSDLMKIKGSDASWQHDIEIPPEFADYSDDEKEREARRESRGGARNGAENPNGTNKRPKPDREGNATRSAAERNKNKNPKFRQRQQNQKTYNPFTGQKNPAVPKKQQGCEIRWSSNPNVSFGAPYRPLATPIPTGWDWSLQAAAMTPAHPRVYNPAPAAIQHPYGVPFCNVPPFMRPARFTVSPYDWTPRPRPGAPPSPQMARFPTPKNVNPKTRFPPAGFSVPKNFGNTFVNPVASTSSNPAYAVAPPPPPPPLVNVPPTGRPLSDPSTSAWPMCSFPAPPGT